MQRDFKKLADELLLNSESILQNWLPDGLRNGSEYKSINPTRSDSKVGSFSININNGKWSDFADDASGGDLISLYGYLFNLTNSDAYDALINNQEHKQYATNNYIRKNREIVEEWEVLPLPPIEPNGEHYELGFPIERYKYDNFYIFRYLKSDGSKDIRPLSYRVNSDGVKKWKWKGISNNRAIYNSHKINNKPILIVEGEKAGNVEVDGYIVVSWAGGSNAINKTDWSKISFRNDVYLWADRDEAGFKTVGVFQQIIPLINIIPIDFSVGDGQDIADITHEEVQDKLKFFIKSNEKIEQQIVKEEIVTRYEDKYPEILPVERGVIIAKTGAGKTFTYENKEKNLILVPRVLQTTVDTGESADFLINKIMLNGAIVTYNKFYGHYRNNDEFRHLVDNKIIKIIVDEAHMLIAMPSKMHKVIYYLDAVFMSGTLEKFFRQDLQRYKYTPIIPEVIYYTENGGVPNIKGSLVFVENATALMQNYPDNCVVGESNKHKNLNVHTTDKKTVFATSCLREGISIKNDNFKATVVDSKNCKMWSTKDAIQALHRVRIADTIKVYAGEPKEEYSGYLNMQWWKDRVIELSDNQQSTNAVFGEMYSKMIKLTHRTNDYIEPDEYGLACFLADKTKNNYDKDFYQFEPYTKDFKAMKINTDTIKEAIEEDDGIIIYTMQCDDTRWEFEASKLEEFKKWAIHYETGLVKQVIKIKDTVNLHYLYTNSRLSKSIKKNYNASRKKAGQKYRIDMFLKLLQKLVKMELYLDGKKKVRIKDDIRKYDVKFTNICSIDGVTLKI